MTTFTIDPENNITAHPSEAAAVSAASGESFASQEALKTLTASWPIDRFVTIWNSFAGVAGFGGRTVPHCPRSLRRWAGRPIRFAVLWPGR